MSSHPARHRVVVVGGGFGGIQATLKLARMPVDVTLVDRRNFHLFQPLAYQVATGVLSPAEICYPVRRIFRRRRNVEVVLAEVHDVDLDARQVMLRPVVGEVAPDSIPYDTLIVSGGSHYSYFGHDEWREPAAELKSLEGALTLRNRILGAFEAAELESDPRRRTASPSASRRARWCGRRAWSPPSSPACSRTGPARRSTAPAGSRSWATS